MTIDKQSKRKDSQTNQNKLPSFFQTFNREEMLQVQQIAVAYLNQFFCREKTKKQNSTTTHEVFSPKQSCALSFAYDVRINIFGGEK